MLFEFTFFFSLLTSDAADRVIFETNIKKMDSESWTEREEGQKVIQQFAYNEKFIKELEAISTNKSYSLEVRRRCERAMCCYYNVLPSNYDKIPWLDCIPDADERKEAIDKYRPQDYILYTEGVYDKEYPSYRSATAAYIIDKMKNSGWTRHKAIKFLNSMAETEKIARQQSILYPEYKPASPVQNQ